MYRTPNILSFDFEVSQADQDELIQAWLPEIEQAALTHVADDRMTAFFIAALRIGSKTKSMRGLSLMKVAEKAGYSRSTFFRIFESNTHFLLKSYKLACLLSTRVYADYLNRKEMDFDEFCKFTTDVFYGANCTVPHDILKMLWKENESSHIQFHPHVSEIAPLIGDYLKQNHKIEITALDVKELDGVLKSLDLVILNARLEDDPLWGTPYYYRKLKNMLSGYLSTCIRNSGPI
ncbi:MAG TPA: hypothetical protein VLA39_11375 [Marinobacterium sp.]|nr:hypothetical protein [Marinobacterium sp.]